MYSKDTFKNFQKLSQIRKIRGMKKNTQTPYKVRFSFQVNNFLARTFILKDSLLELDPSLGRSARVREAVGTGSGKERRAIPPCLLLPETTRLLLVEHKRSKNSIATTLTTLNKRWLR